MINWREKFLAFAIHFVATAALGACAAALIFLVWFPHPFATMIGGTELFLLVVGCDLALGPLLSLVVYNTRKSRGKLVFDYVVIGILQLCAMLYGVYIVAGTRPVYVAFSMDRFEIVTARDIDDKELAAARSPEYRRLPLTGPKLINVVVSKADHNDALFEALAGNEEHQRPKFYQPFASGLEKIRRRARMVPSPASRNRPSSCGSRAKLLTTLMDERISNMRSTSDDSSALTRSARSTIRRE